MSLVYSAENRDRTRGRPAGSDREAKPVVISLSISPPPSYESEFTASWVIQDLDSPLAQMIR